MYIENIKIKNYIAVWLVIMFWLVTIMIIVGGLTRLTDSGLSITKWQLFSGLIPPLNSSDWENYFNLYKEIPEFKIQNYSMSLDEFKVIFWWEWIHRFLGRLIGIFFLIPLIYFSIKVGYSKLVNLYLIFFLICFQGFIGWYMVSSGLVDRVDVSHFRLSLHLLIAFIILSLLFWNYLSLKIIRIYNDKYIFFISLIFLFIIFCQIIVGAFVSGMDAGKLYNSWPLMGSSFFPDDNKFAELFKLSVFNDPSLVQFIHRNLAYLIFIFYLFILFKIYKNMLVKFYFAINLLGVLIIVQIILGILTLIYGAQIILSSMHQISSIFLVTSSVYFTYLSSRINQQPSS